MKIPTYFKKQLKQQYSDPKKAIKILGMYAKDILGSERGFVKDALFALCTCTDSDSLEIRLDEIVTKANRESLVGGSYRERPKETNLGVDFSWSNVVRAYEEKYD